MTRVLALHLEEKRELDGCQIYRVNMPLFHLGQNGWDTRVEDMGYFVKQFRKHGRGVFYDMVDQFDLFIFPRAAFLEGQNREHVAAIFYLIRLLGKRSIYEVDDDFTGTYRDLRHLNIHDASVLASWCDAVTVTTPYLAKTMQKHTRRPVHVLPNMLDPQVWKRPEKHLPEHEGIVIGLSGSSTHEKDWRIVAEPLKRILENTYDEPVTLRVTGFTPEYLRDYPNTEYYPGLEYLVYAEMVRDCDIILAPVEPEDRFNLGKSPIKVTEGMGASRPVGNTVGGAACIATDNPVYQLGMTSGKTGLLVLHNEESWYNGLDTLLRNKDLRQQLQVEGHTQVWKRHDITSQWKLWARAYQATLNKPINPTPLPYSPEKEK